MDGMSERKIMVGARVTRVSSTGDKLTGTVTSLRYGLWRVEWDNGTVSAHHRNELETEQRDG